MDLFKKFLILLAIFCVIGSAAAISAAEDVGVDDQGGYAGSQYQDDIGDEGTTDDGEDNPASGSDDDSQELNGPQPFQENDTNTGNNTIGNNTSGNTSGNNSGNNTGNVTPQNNNPLGALHNLLSTGNPIFILVILVAIVGGVTVLRRK